MRQSWFEHRARVVQYAGIKFSMRLGRSCLHLLQFVATGIRLLALH